jgi:hypothetical protein
MLCSNLWGRGAEDRGNAKLLVLVRLRGATPGRHQLYAGRGAGLFRTDAKKLIKPSQDSTK